MLTCKEFLAELSEFLDDETDACIKAKLERHATECPNCWVICDTTRKTIQVYKGMESCTIPPDVHERLIAALERKIASQHEVASQRETPAHTRADVQLPKFS